jgi:hypothetical protein
VTHLGSDWRANLANWEELLHPRDKNGRFTDVADHPDIQVITRGGDGGLHASGAVLTGQAAHDAVPKGLYKRGTMTPEQRESLTEYETGWFMAINQFLRKDMWGNPGKSREEQDVNRIDTAMADSPLPQPVQGWRGLFLARNLFGDQLDGDLSGFSWHEKGYGSMTTNEDVVRTFTHGSPHPDATPAVGAVKMRVHVAAGVHALGTSTHTRGSKHNGPQAELTLEHDLVWKVVKDHGTDAEGTRLVDVTVTRPGSGT